MLRSKRPHFQSVKTIESFAILRLQRLLLPLADASQGVSRLLATIVRT